MQGDEPDADYFRYTGSASATQRVYYDDSIDLLQGRRRRRGEPVRPRRRRHRDRGRRRPRLRWRRGPPATASRSARSSAGTPTRSTRAPVPGRLPRPAAAGRPGHPVAGRGPVPLPRVDPRLDVVRHQPPDHHQRRRCRRQLHRVLEPRQADAQGRRGRQHVHPAGLHLQRLDHRQRRRPATTPSTTTSSTWTTTRCRSTAVRASTPSSPSGPSCRTASPSRRGGVGVRIAGDADGVDLLDPRSPATPGVPPCRCSRTRTPRSVSRATAASTPAPSGCSATCCTASRATTCSGSELGPGTETYLIGGQHGSTYLLGDEGDLSGIEGTVEVVADLNNLSCTRPRRPCGRSTSTSRCRSCSTVTSPTAPSRRSSPVTRSTGGRARRATSTPPRWRAPSGVVERDGSETDDARGVRITGLTPAIRDLRARGAGRRGRPADLRRPGGVGLRGLDLLRSSRAAARTP
jgi:hypothetical protein